MAKRKQASRNNPENGGTLSNVDIHWGRRGQYDQLHKPLLDLKVGRALRITNAGKNTASALRQWLIKSQNGNYRVRTRYIAAKRIAYVGKFAK